MLFKNSLIYVSSGSSVQFIRMINAILLEGIMRNISVKYFEFGPVAQEMSFEDIFTLIQRIKIICAILIEGNMRNIFVKHSYFLFGPVVQEEMSFKNVSNPKLWQHCCSAEHNHFYYFGSAHYEKRFCKIVMNLDQWFIGKMSFKKKKLKTLVAPFCGALPLVLFC